MSTNDPGFLHPLLARTLLDLGWLAPMSRPLLAAHWLAAGLDGAAMRDLAGRAALDPEVSVLWRAALLEAGVAPGESAREQAAGYLAEQVLAGVCPARSWCGYFGVDRDGAWGRTDALSEVALRLDAALDMLDLNRAGSWRYAMSAEQMSGRIEEVLRAAAALDFPRCLRLLDAVGGG